MIKLEKTVKLTELTCLDENVKIYVPSTMDVNNAIDSTFFVNEIKKFLSNLFGGCTAYNGSGAWYSDDLKSVVNEQVTIIQAFTSDLNNEQIDNVITACTWLKQEMKQECISMEVNGKLYFV